MSKTPVPVFKTLLLRLIAVPEKKDQEDHDENYVKECIPVKKGHFRKWILEV
jgi:hypothetical protein